MTVKITDPNARQKIDEVETPNRVGAWMAEDANATYKPTTFSAKLEAYNKIVAKRETLRSEGDPDGELEYLSQGHVMVEGHPSIAGIANFHRYFVRKRDGVIVFSAHHSNGKAIERARNHGFDIHE